jgi:hypothetical protein
MLSYIGAKGSGIKRSQTALPFWKTPYELQNLPPRQKIYKLRLTDIETGTSAIPLSTPSYGMDRLLIELTPTLTLRPIDRRDLIAISKLTEHIGFGGKVRLRFTQTMPQDNLVAAPWTVTSLIMALGNTIYNKPFGNVPIGSAGYL